MSKPNSAQHAWNYSPVLDALSLPVPNPPANRSWWIGLDRESFYRELKVQEPRLAQTRIVTKLVEDTAK